MVQAAPDLQPGESAEPFADEKRGVKLVAPDDQPMIFRSSHFVSKDEAVICEFKASGGLTISGLLRREEFKGELKDYADGRKESLTIANSVKPDKVELLNETTLDDKPSGQQWLVREYSLKSQFGTMLEQHAFIPDGAGNVYELILTDNIREAEFARPVMAKFIAGLTIAPPGAATQPAIKPVAGFIFSGMTERDIYLLKDGETKPINLTNSPGFDNQCSFARDGTQIAFITDRDSPNPGTGAMSSVHVMNADGSNVRWVVKDDHSRQPRFSPDGKQLVFTSTHDFGNGRGGSFIKTINVDGSGLKLLTEQGWHSRDPDWSPDGKKIVYSSFVPGKESSQGGIFTMNPDGSEKTCIVTVTRADCIGRYPRWSPDGKQIIFTGREWQEVPLAGEHYLPFGATMICDADGTNLRLEHLTHDAQPQLLPKLNKIAFLAVHGGDYVKSGHGLDLFVKNVNGLQTLNITKEIAGGIADYDYSPVAADELLEAKPVPHDIVFAHTGGGFPAFEMFVMTEAGKDFTNLSQTCTYYTKENNPCWSPDKKKIAFECTQPYWENNERTGRFSTRNIWVADCDGSNRTNLTHFNGEEFQPIFSPDGTQIAFQRRLQGGIGLFVMNANGSGVTQIKADFQPHDHMTWSNDGTLILVSGAWGGEKMRFGTVTTDPPVWTNIEKGSAIDPDWNPMSDMVAYFGYATPESKNISLLRFDFPEGMSTIIQERQGSHPTWAPDGCRIAFDTGENGGGGTILLADITKPGPENIVNLTQDLGGSSVQPDWSAGPGKYKKPAAPGGCFVIFSVKPSRDDDPRECILMTAKVDGSDAKVIRKGPEAINSIACAPDGKTIALTTIVNGNWEVAAMDVDGQNFHNLTNNLTSDSDPQFSPDGKRIAFMSKRGTQWAELYVMGADGKGAVRCDQPEGWGANFTRWSPDSQRLLFSEMDMSNMSNPMEMYAVNADGGGRTALTNLGKSEPDMTSAIVYDKSFSPDGKRLTVSICPPDKSETSSLYVGNADGSNLTPIIKNEKGASVSDICWAADDRIYFLRAAKVEGSLQYTVVSCKPDGSDVKTLISEDMRPYRLRVSPDAKHLMFVSLLKNSNDVVGELYVANIESSDPKRIGTSRRIEFAAWCCLEEAAHGKVP